MCRRGSICFGKIWVGVRRSPSLMGWIVQRQVLNFSSGGNEVMRKYIHGFVKRKYRVGFFFTRAFWMGIRRQRKTGPWNEPRSRFIRNPADAGSAFSDNYFDSVIRCVATNSPDSIRYRYVPLGRSEASNATSYRPAGSTSFTSSATSAPRLLYTAMRT